MKKYQVALEGVSATVFGAVIIHANSLEEAEQKYLSGEFDCEIDSSEILEFPERIGVAGQPAASLDEFYELIDEDVEAKTDVP